MQHSPSFWSLLRLFSSPAAPKPSETVAENLPPGGLYSPVPSIRASAFRSVDPDTACRMEIDFLFDDSDNGLRPVSPLFERLCRMDQEDSQTPPVLEVNSDSEKLGDPDDLSLNFTQPTGYFGCTKLDKKTLTTDNEGESFDMTSNVSGVLALGPALKSKYRMLPKCRFERETETLSEDEESWNVDPGEIQTSTNETDVAVCSNALISQTILNHSKGL